MAFIQIHWSSQILGKQVTTWVLLPDIGTPPFPTFYLLHGMSDDQTTWLRRTRLEIHAAGLPLIIVMPDGGRGFYTDHDNGPKWGTHIGRELPDFIERTFHARPERAARSIGGLSMGGYGALRVALAYPDRFASANSHSGAAALGSTPSSNPERVLIFGRNPARTDHDVPHLARKAKAAGLLPRLRIDCGTEDHLIEDNRALHRALVKLGISHEYEEFPGGHNWEYWDLRVREALRFHAGEPARD